MKLTGYAIFLTCFAAWITHLIVAIQAQAWVFMIVGALLGPVAIVHGFSHWLGYNWLG